MNCRPIEIKLAFDSGQFESGEVLACVIREVSHSTFPMIPIKKIQIWKKVSGNKLHFAANGKQASCE